MRLFEYPEAFNFENPDWGLLEYKHFVVPFLAHALGTLLAAFLVTKFGIGAIKKQALGMGFFFLLGGIAAGIMIKSPMWYNAIDFSMAYFPFAFIGWKLGGSKI